MSQAEVAAAKTLLSTHSDTELARQMVMEVPWVFEQIGTEAFGEWRTSIVDGTTIRPESVFIVGSASVGLSLVAEKAGRPFRTIDHDLGPSDIDIAIVDHRLFMRTWETVVKFERLRSLHVAHQQRPALRAGVYWGFLPHHAVPRNTNESRSLRTVLTSSSRIDPLRGHPASIRVYRRREDLVSYQQNSVRKLRQALS